MKPERIAAIARIHSDAIPMDEDGLIHCDTAPYICDAISEAVAETLSQCAQVCNQVEALMGHPMWIEAAQTCERAIRALPRDEKGGSKNV